MAKAGVASPSPAKMATDQSIVIISSSPEFPSICDLLPKSPMKLSLRSGSNAAPIPVNAPKAFISAASIWRSSRHDEEEKASVLESSIAAAANSAVLAAVKTPSNGIGEPSEVGAQPSSAAPSRRKKSAAAVTSEIPTYETGSGSATADMLPPKKPEKKARSTKDSTMAQTTFPKGKVTKPTSSGRQTKRKAETVSRHFATKPVPSEPERNQVEKPGVDEPLGLESAMSRRRDWTPPRESVHFHHVADSSAVKEPVSSAGMIGEDGGPAHKGGFRRLLDTYGQELDADRESGIGGAASSFANPKVLGKRKVIDLVPTTGNKPKTPEASPSKPKAAKKKPRTITELATAAYRLPDESDASTDAPKQDVQLGSLGDPGERKEEMSKTPRVNGKTSKKTTKPKPPKKKAEALKPVLLSPTTAMRQVAKQDFVFGTASQLATEDDPDLLRALHQAMKESNQADSDPFASPSPLNSELAFRGRLGTGLWAAGARDEDGDLLDLEVLDLTRSSPVSGDNVVPTSPRNGDPAALDRAVPQQASIGDGYTEIRSSDDHVEDVEPPAMASTTFPSTSSLRRISQDSTRSHDDRSRLPTPAIDPDLEPPPSNQEHHELLLSNSSSPLQAAPEAPPRPNFELYTDARLAKEVASYGFKAVKKRVAMIALLNQCWDSKNVTGSSGGTAYASICTSFARQAASPPRPRGRPRKNPGPTASDVRAKSPAPVSKRGRRRLSETEIEAPQVDKRPRGRPRKDGSASPRKPAKAQSKTSSTRPRSKSPPAVAAAAPRRPGCAKAPAKPVVEIADSDSDDPFSSSPGYSADQQEVFSPAQMDLSVTEDTETSLMASPTSQQVALFRYITQAVISAERSKDPMDPSWHEKMLMYDPIILEDLTAWLNSGQLDRVGYDGEVSPGDVKKWCESKSVCCLWRVNLNGKERKRF